MRLFWQEGVFLCLLIRLRYIYAPARAVTVTLASDVSFSFLQEDQTAATAVRAATLFLL